MGPEIKSLTCDTPAEAIDMLQIWIGEGWAVTVQHYDGIVCDQMKWRARMLREGNARGTFDA
jgi:hypothetical protein